MREGSVHALAVVAAVAFVGAVFLVGCPEKPTPAPSSAGGSSAPQPATTPPPASATPAASAPAGPPGSLQGKILAPKAKRAELIDTGNVQADCGQQHDPGSVLVEDDGSLAGAVVYLKGPKAPAGWPDKSKPIEVTNPRCHFEPRISIVPMGVPVAFTNEDTVLHNVAAVASQNDKFDQSVPGNGRLEHTFASPEFIPIKCSVHTFMAGEIVVSEHPWYALSGAKGAYKLENVPSGTYKLFVWHETLGKAVPAGTPVTISPGQATTADVKFE